MPAPVAPTQQYDFEDYSASNPNDQQPGDKLDAEFAHHRARIADIVSFVRTQIGDDGYLKGGSIDVDQIGSTVLALLNTTLNFRGDWVTATAYAVSDVVEVDEISYVCIVAHTAGTFATDRTTNGYWQIFAALESTDTTVLADRISGDGTTGPFTLTETLGTDENIVLVFDNAGAIMDPVTDYTLNGNQLTFSANTTVGTNNYQVRALAYGVKSAEIAAQLAQAAAEAAQAAAAASEAAAGVSEINAAASYDAFDDRYLGSKSSAPSLDNDGDALLDGALYWDTTDNDMYVYDLGGTAWVTVSNSATSIAAAASASAALTSETNAGTSESAASTSASNASTSASNASTSASNASTSASNAATAQTAAEAAQAAAEAALDEFTDTYLGAKATDPTVDNDGNALTTGDQYFNTGSNVLKIWNGSSWQAAALSANDFVSKTSGTGSAGIPVGTTGQRDGSPATGYFRYNSTENQFEGYDGSAWGQIGGGAGYFKGDNGTVGSSAGDIFRINEAELNANVTIAATENASATGPVGVASGVTLTVDGVLVII
jgi:hypothetical protein